MKLDELESNVEKYLKNSTSDWSGEGFNMFITAANNARKRAEMNASWNHLLVNVELTVLGLSGVALDTAILTGDVSEDPPVVLINNIRRGYLVNDGCEFPVDLVSKDKVVSDIRQEQHRMNSDWRFGVGTDPVTIWPSEVGIYPYMNRRTPVRLMRNGNQLFIYPLCDDTVSSLVHLDVYKWADDYPTTDYGDVEDWFLLRGTEYMMWSTIVELNHLMKEYVPREEGNLPTPTAFRDNAWNLLSVNEAYCDVFASEHFKD